jgi:acylphosphatase
MAEKRMHLTISGRVQGVFFRASTKETARALDLRGWVKNLADGRVEAVFEGDEEALLRMLDWCRRGPPGAEPTDIEPEWLEGRGEFRDFRVVYR